MLRLHFPEDDFPRVPPERLKAARDQSPLKYITRRQQLWAFRRGLKLVGSAGDRGARMYCQTLNENLYQPLSPQTRQEFERADGGELRWKMRAVHSSSALVVNFFDFWRSFGDFNPALRALNLPVNPSVISFEAKLSIASRFAKGPNIDLLVLYLDHPAVLIESKFSEPFGREHAGFPPKYFGIPGLWRDLPNVRRLAEQIAGPTDSCFGYLHASQLIKHVLAADQAFGKDFILIYFFHDVYGEAGVEHRREIEHFSKYLREDGVSFRAVTHQDYLLKLAERERPHHQAFTDYLTERYL